MLVVPYNFFTYVYHCRFLKQNIRHFCHMTNHVVAVFMMVRTGCFKESQREFLHVGFLKICSVYLFEKCWAQSGRRNSLKLSEWFKVSLWQHLNLSLKNVGVCALLMILVLTVTEFSHQMCRPCGWCCSLLLSSHL